MKNPLLYSALSSLCYSLYSPGDSLRSLYSPVYSPRSLCNSLCSLCNSLCSLCNSLCSLCNSLCSLWLKKIFFLIALLSSPFLLTAQKKTVIFTDVTRKSGIDFKYTFGDLSYRNILESSGSGVTIFDYNNDGLMDIFLLNGTYLEGISDPSGQKFRYSHNELYRNNGNGTFSSVTKTAGLERTFWSMAASATDIDGDGDQDLYLLNYGPNVFYRNNGDGTFTDITSSLGLEGPSMLNGFVKWSIGATFWDHNHDGRADVMVGNFLAFDPGYKSPATPDLMPHPSEYKGQASIFYQQGEDGRFIDVTEKSGLFYPDSKCMGLTVYDYDYDNDIDIFQANDHQLNFMFRNENGLFREAGVESGVAANSDGKGSGSMHGTPGDIDGDGLIDILVTDLEHGALYKNLGNGLFTDISVQSGIAGHLSGKGGWGAAFFDYDNDGDLDIVSANGTAEELVLQYPLLLENDGKGNFRDSGKESGAYFNTRRSGRGLAVLDFDNDGNMDVIINHVDLISTPSLLHNEGGNGNHWLGMRLIGKNGPSSAIGARVTVTAGGKKQVFVNQWSASYLSNNDPRIHAGLGQASNIDMVEIDWPDGTHEIFSRLLPDRYLNIKQGTGIVNR